MSANTAPGTTNSGWRPTPPQRGSFPLDHDHECSKVMTDYLNCLRYSQGTNSHGCRLVAKNYLQCRMDNGLMDKDEWKNLGLPGGPNSHNESKDDNATNASSS